MKPVNSNKVTNKYTEPDALPEKSLMFQEDWVIPFEELQIDFELGKGSFGIVYKAIWKGYDVAVKQLLEQNINAKQMSDFRNEGELMMSIGFHPNVVLLYGVCNRPLCLVTEYLHGGSLHTMLKNPEIKIHNLTPAFCKDVTLGLGFLHDKTLIHRDLATRNVLVDYNWTCKLGDFGMSRVGADATNFTKTDVGPLKWMAPEAIKNQSYSIKTDMYSLGVTFTEILNREDPFPGKLPVQVAVDVIQHGARPKIPEWVPEELYNLIWSVFETDPNKRPTCTTVYQTLCSIENIWPYNDEEIENIK